MRKQILSKRRSWRCLLFVLTTIMVAPISLTWDVITGSSAIAADNEAPLNFSFTLEAPGQKVLVDDFRLHVDCRGEGETTVLFEAGLGGSSIEWIPVQELVAERARACIYDRAGYAWSDPSPFSSHAVELAREADLMLDRIGANGPLLLVGHSFGGFIVRELALRRETDMVGMVLVDASHEDQLSRLESLAGKSMMPRGTSFVVSPVQVPESLPEDLQRKVKAFSRMRKTYTALHSEMQYFRESAMQVRRDRTLVHFPVVVISRGLDLYPDDELGRKKTAIWKELQEDLATLSSDSTLIVASESGHHIHTEDPALVAAVINNILDAQVAAAAGKSDMPTDKIDDTGQ